LEGTNNVPLVGIGVPVYNGEEFIEKRLESILNQTFTDFEVIISDNASTDRTQEICKKYEKNDKRIRFFQQEKNCGLFHNYEFVLNHANGKYFVDANVDDFWHEDFLKENVSVLESNPQIVVSMSKIKRYGSNTDEFRIKPKDTFVQKRYKKFRDFFRPFNIIPISGTFEEKVIFCLRNFNFWIQFGVFRREKLLKSIHKKPFYGWDWAMVLKSLQYGDVHVINKELLFFYTGGSSSKGITKFFKTQNISRLFLLFPYYSFTEWCRKNIGTKFIFKNLDYFLWINILGSIAVLKDQIGK